MDVRGRRTEDEKKTGTPVPGEINPSTDLRKGTDLGKGKILETIERYPKAGQLASKEIEHKRKKSVRLPYFTDFISPEDAG